MKKLVLVFAVLFACGLFSCTGTYGTGADNAADTTAVADSDSVVTVDSVAVDSVAVEEVAE